MTSPNEPLTDAEIDEIVHGITEYACGPGNGDSLRLCAQAREANALRTAPAPSEGKALEAWRPIIEAAQEYKREYLSGLDDETPKAKLFKLLEAYDARQA